MKNLPRQWFAPFVHHVVLLILILFCIFGISATAQEDAAKLSENNFNKLSEGLFNKDFSDVKKNIASVRFEQIKHPFFRELAESMRTGKFDKKARKIKAEAYEPLKSVSERLKISSYSLFENPTGIFFEKGDQAILYVDGIVKEPVDLFTFDFSPDNQGRKSYPLKNGINVIDMEARGLAYISYYTPEFKKVSPVTVNVISGQVNGIFDKKRHNNEDWKKILEKTVYTALDIVGEYVHLAWPVEELRKFCPNKGKEMIEYYDTLIYNEQDLMGLFKYKVRPKNRMSGRVMYKGYMHADGIGAAFVNTSMSRLLNEKDFAKGVWATSHEFGHVNQIRPGFTWSGTIECTTNLYSCWNNLLLAPSEMRLEHEAHGDSRGNKVRGGRFNAYLNEAIAEGKPWMFQNGPNGEPNEHFVKICALWQLQLYFSVARMGNSDFYKDVLQIVRNTDYKDMSSGEIQMKFIEIACQVARQDLTDFFLQCGMLRPVEAEINDYGKKSHVIPQALADKTISKIKAKKYRKPASPVIHYITSLTADVYRNKRPVAGVANEGIEEKEFSLSGKEVPKGAKEPALIISSEVWKNVVAFETYSHDKLTRIAIFGTDAGEDLATTRVQYPAGSTRVEAVGWNGTRLLVYGEREMEVND